MNRFLIGFVVIATIVVLVVADAQTEVDASRTAVIGAQDSTNENNTSEIEEGRIRRHHLFSPFYGGLLGLGGLGGIGGLQTLAVLYAIKVKILIVAAIVGLSVYYYAKFGKTYETIIPYEAYSPHGPSGYSSHSEIFAEHGPPEYSSYPGPDPYSGWNSGPQHDHHEHHDYSSLSQHAPGFEEHSEYFDRAGPPSPSAQSSEASSAPATGSSTGSASENLYRQKRQIDTGILEDINWGEIAFQFLGVDTMGCRKRFVCELDFRSIRNPFTRVITAFIGKKFFDRYRDLSPDSPKPAQFEDCAKMYRECAAASAYNGSEDEEASATEEADELSADTTEKVDEVKEDDDVKDDDATDDSNNDIARMINRGRLILLRADQ